ncbi:PUA domain-containing protein [Methanolapillus ohkumae]
MMADYQFGKGVGKVLFDDHVTFLLSKTKRIRQIRSDGERLATVRAKDGFFTLSMKGASRIHLFLKAPALRVVVCDDAVPFVSKGKTAFAKHIISIDSTLRAKEEVLITDRNDRLIATGQLALSPDEIMTGNYGVGVFVRNGIEKEDNPEE